MQLLNDKGKLFGLVNPVDLVAIVLILAIAVGFYVKLHPAGKTTRMGTVEVMVVAPWLRSDVANSVHVGDKLVANGGFTDATVTAVKVKPGAISTTRSDGTRLLTTDPFNKDLFVTFRSQTALGEADLSAGGQPVKIGKDDFVLKTQMVEVKAMVTAINVLTQ